MGGDGVGGEGGGDGSSDFTGAASGVGEGGVSSGGGLGLRGFPLGHPLFPFLMGGGWSMRAHSSFLFFSPMLPFGRPRFFFPTSSPPSGRESRFDAAPLLGREEGGGRRGAGVGEDDGLSICISSLASAPLCWREVITNLSSSSVSPPLSSSSVASSSSSFPSTGRPRGGRPLVGRGGFCGADDGVDESSGDAMDRAASVARLGGRPGPRRTVGALRRGEAVEGSKEGAPLLPSRVARAGRPRFRVTGGGGSMGSSGPIASELSLRGGEAVASPEESREEEGEADTAVPEDLGEEAEEGNARVAGD